MSTTTHRRSRRTDDRAKPHVDSDRAVAENRLGQKLVAPAVIMMLLVTAYPMLQALYLSLFRYRLTAPDDKEFVGLGNYVTVLTDSLFWQDTCEHRAHHGGHRRRSSSSSASRSRW